jgi:hypothetical protein
LCIFMQMVFAFAVTNIFIFAYLHLLSFQVIIFYCIWWLFLVSTGVWTLGLCLLGKHSTISLNYVFWMLFQISVLKSYFILLYMAEVTPFFYECVYYTFFPIFCYYR